MRLQNKIALITGGANGMGAAEAKLFAREGACVVIADMDDVAGEQMATEITTQGSKALFVHLDVTQEGQWAAAAKKVKETFGGLHILVNNAGINGGKPIPAEDIDTWNKIYAVNVTGPMLGMKTFCRMMRDSGGGSIINISSGAGTTGHWLAAYSSSKWALRGLSLSAALTFAPWGIRSNAILPGFVQTKLGSKIPMTPMLLKLSALERPGEVEEIAQAALFLASDEASYITGQEFGVDGGFQGTAPYGTVARVSGMLKNMLDGIE